MGGERVVRKGEKSIRSNERRYVGRLMNGFFGITNLKLFNTTLLGIWDWKVKIEMRGIWFEALMNKYRLNNGVLNLWTGGVLSWWKNISQLDIGSHVPSNEYLVKEVYKSLSSNDQPLFNQSWTTIWNKAISSKISCMVWRMLQNKIPTKYNLA